MGTQQHCSVLSRNHSMVHAAAPRVTLLNIPVLRGCYTGPLSQPEPKWHPAPPFDMMPQPLGQKASELQLAEGWRGRTWGLLAHPIPTLLPCPQGGPQPTRTPTCTTHRSPAAPTMLRKTQKRASQSKLGFLPSVRVSQALLTKITFVFLASRCVKPYQTLLLLLICLLALM